MHYKIVVRTINKKSFWSRFKKVDTFTKLFIISITLLTIATPFIVLQAQRYNTYGQSEQEEQLREIQRLQRTQTSIRNSIARAPSDASNTTVDEANVSAPKKEFNFVNLIGYTFFSIVNFFANLAN
jgi:hypothetical protein